MTNPLSRMRCEWHGPATAEDIRTAEVALECRLDPELVELYRAHDGVPYGHRCLPWRLMPLGEAVELHLNLKQQWLSSSEDVPWYGMGVRAFWTDDNSNLAGVSMQGCLQGRVCVVDHEDTDISPWYRSVGSFVKALVDAHVAGQEWFDMEREWPSDQHVDEDLRLGTDLVNEMDRAQDDWARSQYGLSAVTVLPLSATGKVMHFLHDRDMWVQAKAAEELGRRRFAEAVGELAWVAEHGMGNGQHASIIALGEIGTKAATKELLRLASAKNKGLSTLLEIALRTCGFTAEFDRRGRWRYRHPGSEQWVELP